MHENVSPERKMLMHLKLLYSDAHAAAVAALAWETSVEPELSSLLETFDLERLAFEREQRLRSLQQHLGRQAPAFWSVLGETASFQLIRSFANSPAFWERRGRSMLENLCLFAHAQLEREGPAGVSELARLVGIVSGLSRQPGAISPWARALPVPEQLHAPGLLAAEAFEAEHELIDEQGGIALGARRRPHWAFVLCFTDRSIVVGTTERNT